MSTPIRKFQPSNHTVGAAFIADWCGTCQHGQYEPCDIAARTMWLKVEDPEYPEEWQYDAEGDPVCTAHTENGQPVPPSRCKHTVDMLDGLTDVGRKIAGQE